MKCPDCKDGFYYPFVGPPEPCQTCAIPDELHGIYSPKDAGLFYHKGQCLGKILEINVLDYHPLATRFDGNCVTEYTDPESEEFRRIAFSHEPRTWWGFQYIVEHLIAGPAKFNYRPIDFEIHFLGPCEVTLKKMIFHKYAWYRKVMTQL